jgi:flagellar basal-body rod protein FlgG
MQLATFQNEAGLQAKGFNLFNQTDASGAPVIGNPQTQDRGSTQQGFVELSNVSVVEELVNLISAQRAYEVNSKTVQTADEMLQISNNMKR